jgi:hypothetical protein
MKLLAVQLAKQVVPDELVQTAMYDEIEQLWVSEGGIRAEPITSTPNATIQTIRTCYPNGTCTTTTSGDSRPEAYT